MHEVCSEATVKSCDAFMCPCMHDGQRDRGVVQAHQHQVDLHTQQGHVPACTSV